MTDRTRRRALVLAAATAAVAAAGLVLRNQRLARRAERRNPPLGHVGRFDGVALHWIDTEPQGTQAEGPPVVLLHGNLVSLEDWISSGVVDRLVAAGRRVVAFDRPGFGHSERPPGGRWGASEQAAILRRATQALGVERPVVVGQSWGALVALAWALDAPEDAEGVGLVAGYYYPSARLDAVFVAPAATPGLGPALRHTVAPPFSRATLPATLQGMFAPLPVPPRFQALFPHELVSRPSQIRATASDGAIMVGEAAHLLERLRAMPASARWPVAVVAGLEDHVVGPEDQAERLARELPEARLLLVRGAGHMVHHAAPEAVADAILALGRDGGLAPAPVREVAAEPAW